MLRRFLPLLVLTALALFVGCKGCKADPCDDTICLTGETCVDGACIPEATGCDPACAADEVCQAGQCVSLDPQCEEIDEECDASLPVNDGFVCLDLDGFGPRPGACAPNCEPDGSCPIGSLCFFLQGNVQQACESDADCADNEDCFQQVCRETVCRPSECDGFLSGQQTCAELYGGVPGFESGAQCYAVGNGARYCYPAGTRREGDTCSDAIQGITNQSFESTCAAGLACVDSACQAACEDDSVCSADQECILESEDFVDDGVGICGDGCTPFESGICGDGFTCLPISAEEGVCVPAGNKTAFEECTPGEGECVDGTLCVTYQNSPAVIARCQPVCNVTVAEANEDGSVGDFAQSQRDATCPQPESIDAWLSVVNLADVGSAVDIYVDDEATPRIEGLALDGRTDADDQMAGAQWLSVEPGSYTMKVLPAGAPSTDPPLAESTIAFSVDDAVQLVLLPVVGANDEVSLTTLDGDRDVTPPTAGSANVRVLGGLVDVDPADVILVPTGDDLSDPNNQTELADDLAVGTRTAFTEVVAGDYDVIVFGPGDPRTDRATAEFQGSVTFAADTSVTLALRGTVDPDDTPFAGYVLLDVSEAPAVGAGGPTFTCVDIGNEVFGYCQQSCGNDSTGFDGGLCEGEGMACHPTLLEANNRWANLCSPLGDIALGDPCDPFNEFDGCAAGTYCLEYGNTAPDFDPLNRGRCVSYCIEDDAENAVLTCEADQGCQPISVDPDYVVGRCGYPCTPDENYADTTACPAGLEACKPTAALVDDVANPENFPDAVVQPSFCSAAGDIAAGDGCSGSDCTPGSECMFPRSEQNTFVGTLVSQYFGASGLSASCTLQCDPFDGDSSATTCGSDETCLFNFPWSAEVGHCAPIVEERAPLEACSNPGQSCGENSICVVNAGSASCFEFCQYDGPDDSGELQPESCTAGFLCAPFVADIGVCLSP